MVGEVKPEFEAPPEIFEKAANSIRAHFDLMRDQAVNDLAQWMAQIVKIHSDELNMAYRGKIFGALIARRDGYAKGSPEWKAFDDYLEQLGAKTHHDRSIGKK